MGDVWPEMWKVLRRVGTLILAKKIVNAMEVESSRITNCVPFKRPALRRALVPFLVSMLEFRVSQSDSRPAGANEVGESAIGLRLIVMLTELEKLTLIAGAKDSQARIVLQTRRSV